MVISTPQITPIVSNANVISLDSLENNVSPIPCGQRHKVDRLGEVGSFKELGNDRLQGRDYLVLGRRI